MRVCLGTDAHTYRPSTDWTLQPPHLHIFSHISQFYLPQFSLLFKASTSEVSFCICEAWSAMILVC